MNSAEQSFSAIDKRFRRDPEVDRGAMFGGIDLRVGGKVFAALYKGQLVLKLPRSRVDALIAAGRGERFDPGHGRRMKEWARMLDPQGKNLIALAREARAFVGATETTRQSSRKTA